MTPIRWIENSRKAYATLLGLYPKEHRDDYGTSMQQVFADQCHNAYQQKGALGVVLLWLRTLPDLGYTALLEHVTAPNASAGLLEPVPNAPLPWKGVFLILLPGLVYLVSQITQLTGQPWYMTVYYRAAFFLVIPVLLVWAITHRFPLWGLIPLGLLYRLVQEIGYQLIVLHPDAFSNNPLLNQILNLARLIQQQLWLIILPMTLAILFLAWRYLRQQKTSRSFWVWIGLYILIICIEISKDYLWLAQQVREDPEHYNIVALRDWFSSGSQTLYPTIALLLLSFIGTLFARRHGFFAILILVGYIMPASLVGLWNFDEFSNPTLALVVFSTAILVYRSLLSFIAPVWMSRTSSQASKKQVVLISIVVALCIQTVMQFYPALLYPEPYPITSQWFFSVILEELKLISIICLGIVMYQNIRATYQTANQVPTEYIEFSIKKA